MGDPMEAGKGIDPLHFSITLFIILLMFVFYLLLPRGFRVHYFHSYPKRYVWSARSRGATSSRKSNIIPTVTNSSSSRLISPPALPPTQHSSSASASQQAQHHRSSRGRTGDSMDKPTQPDDEIIISATMQQLREPGILIVAHGSRGKPKTVRLQLTETAITWRTETRKKVQSNTATPKFLPPKLGKLHQVPLSHIMYVDVGKQTTALRRVENASVSESLCFSLLTKEGSLDLEASSPRERDALVNCFSLVLDEVHAQNWRDIYRGPSSDNMPSSFDDFEADTAAPS